MSAERIIVGQAPECDIVITDDPYVSATHCEIVRLTLGWVVRDLGSLNGTSVERDGTRHKITFLPNGWPLRKGDVIWLGLRTALPRWDR